MSEDQSLTPLLLCSEHEEQDCSEADGRVLSPCCGGEDQTARHQVPARFQRPERRGQYIYSHNLEQSSHFNLLVVISVCLSNCAVDPQHFDADPHCKEDSSVMEP